MTKINEIKMVPIEIEYDSFLITYKEDYKDAYDLIINNKVIGYLDGYNINEDDFKLNLIIIDCMRKGYATSIINQIRKDRNIIGEIKIQNKKWGISSAFSFWKSFGDEITFTGIDEHGQVTFLLKKLDN